MSFCDAVRQRTDVETGYTILRTRLQTVQGVCARSRRACSTIHDSKIDQKSSVPWTPHASSFGYQPFSKNLQFFVCSFFDMELGAPTAATIWTMLTRLDRLQLSICSKPHNIGAFSVCYFPAGHSCSHTHVMHAHLNYSPFVPFLRLGVIVSARGCRNTIHG